MDDNNLYQMDSEEIYSFLNPKIQKIYHSFCYCGLSEEEFHTYAFNAIEEAKKNYKNQESFSKWVVKQLQKDISAYIKKIFYDKDSSFELINRYINQNMDLEVSKARALDYFDKLNSFFLTNDFSPSSDLLIKLIQKNPIFENMINTIYQSKSSLICSGHMEKISQNSTFLSAMGAYCILNNIEIEYEENDLDIEDMSPADQGPVRAYLKEIGTIPLLTVEQEKDVCARMAGGDKKARDKLASRIYVHKKRIRIFLENYYKPTLDLNNEKVSSLISVESSQDEVKQDLEDRHPSLEMEFHASQEVPKNFLKLISISSNVEMFQSLTIQEATIVMLNLGYFNQKKYSIESIANFFEIEQEVVLEIMKKYWILYNRWCNAILEQMLTASLELKLKSPKNKL